MSELLEALPARILRSDVCQMSSIYCCDKRHIHDTDKSITITKLLVELTFPLPLGPMTAVNLPVRIAPRGRERIGVVVFCPRLPLSRFPCLLDKVWAFDCFLNTMEMLDHEHTSSPIQLDGTNDNDTIESIRSKCTEREEKQKLK